MAASLVISGASSAFRARHLEASSTSRGLRGGRRARRLCLESRPSELRARWPGGVGPLPPNCHPLSRRSAGRRMRGAELCSRARRGCGPLGTGRRRYRWPRGHDVGSAWREGMRMLRGHRCSMDWPAQSTYRLKRTPPLGPDASISALSSLVWRAGEARGLLDGGLAGLGASRSRLVCRGDARGG